MLKGALLFRHNGQFRNSTKIVGLGRALNLLFSVIQKARSCVRSWLQMF